METLQVGSGLRTIPRNATIETKPAQSSDSERIAKIKALLRSAMLRARRKGYWFWLTKPERSLYSLALRLQVKFRSVDLLRALVSILKKLKSMGDERFVRLMEGARLAWTYSEAAVAWGNRAARDWRNERGYIGFLGGIFRWGSA